MKIISIISLALLLSSIPQVGLGYDKNTLETLKTTGQLPTPRIFCPLRNAECIRRSREAFTNSRDLSGANLTGINLKDANLKGADLRGAYFYNEKELKQKNMALFDYKMKETLVTKQLLRKQGAIIDDTTKIGSIIDATKPSFSGPIIN